MIGPFIKLSDEPLQCPYRPKIVKKAWGEEQWLCNNDEFCGKILVFNPESQFSNHFHVKKREVFTVLEGKVELTITDTKDASKETFTLGVGDCFEIKRFVPHQIKSKIGAKIIETSTHHEDSDSYRVERGDSQRQEDEKKAVELMEKIFGKDDEYPLSDEEMKKVGLT